MTLPVAAIRQANSTGACDLLLTTLKWAGTLLTVAGALLTSLSIDPLNVYAFNAGAVLWLWAAVKMKDPALIVVNAALLTIYCFGAIIRL